MMEWTAWTIDAIATFAIPIAAAMWAVRRTNWPWTLAATVAASVIYAPLSAFTIDYAIPDYDRSLSGLTIEAVAGFVVGLLIAGLVIWWSKRSRRSAPVTA